MAKSFVEKFTDRKITPAEIETFFLLSVGAAKEVGKVQYLTSGKDAEPRITTQGSRNFYDSSQPMTDQTIVGIGSISKQFTAATLVKLWDDELLQKKSNPEIKTWFGAGMDTKLQDFMPLLRGKYKCNELFGRIEADENYGKITLRDLLNHTHGLGARDDRATQLVRKAKGAPLELEAIANITTKRKGEEYGKHLYGNFGYDLAAMIIEVVAQEKGIATSFDEAVKKLVLKPYGLNHTHPQSDHANLYAKGADVARGYAIDSEVIDESLREKKEPEGDYSEYQMNGTSNTRAAGGFKSNVADLAKFSVLYMCAEMFENADVKAEILNREEGAKMHPEKPETYHLGIETSTDGLIGHNGEDIIFSSKLRLNPSNGAVRVELKAEETLTDYVARRVFNNLYPDKVDKFDKRNFWEDCKFGEKFAAAGRPEPMSEAGQDVIKDALYSSPETRDIIQKYIEIKEKVSEIPVQELVDGREGVIRKLSGHFKDISQEPKDSFANRVGMGAVKSGHAERAKAAFENNNGSKTH